VDLLEGAMVRNLKLVNGGSGRGGGPADSDMEGEEIEVREGEDGKLIVPGEKLL
jgi:hypothetical protein